MGQVWKPALRFKFYVGRVSIPARFCRLSRIGGSHLTDIKRYYIPESIVFITCATKNRKPILLDRTAIKVFWNTLDSVKSIHSFDIFAYAILPDHFHWLIRPLDEEGDFSKVVHSFKRNFTLNYKKAKGIATRFSFWQSGYWDHVIRDEKDFNEHVKYIHWNPVKHEYVMRPEDWAYSSYSLWLEARQ